MDWAPEPTPPSTASFTPYCEALGIQRVEGRLFDAGDQALTAPVVVVDELLARRYFGAVAAGQHMIDADGTRCRIVGVVRSRKFRTLQESPRATVYYPVTQHYVPQGTCSSSRAGMRRRSYWRCPP